MYCFLCNTKNQAVVCKPCLQHFTTLHNPCLTCAHPLLETTDLRCGQCIKHPPALDAVMAAYAYTAPLRHLIHHFKYQEGYFLTDTLTPLFLQALPQNYTTECIIPVPMHTKRLTSRGFHHTLWLAKALSRQVNLPIDETLCQKITHTSSLTQLNAKQRQLQTQKAYSVGPTTYQHVTLLDDLTTTGETANTLARQLKARGVQTVALWCCAKVLL